MIQLQFYPDSGRACIQSKLMKVAYSYELPDTMVIECDYYDWAWRRLMKTVEVSGNFLGDFLIPCYCGGTNALSRKKFCKITWFLQNMLF